MNLLRDVLEWPLRKDNEMPRHLLIKILKVIRYSLFSTLCNYFDVFLI